jgi:hypothetical protein
MRLIPKELAAYQWPQRNDCIAFDADIAGFGLRKRNGKFSWIF